MALELVDLKEIVTEYAEDFLDHDKKKHADLKAPIIDWTRMHVDYGETQYINPSRAPKPTAHVLFTANFTNDTPKPQTYSLRTERRTTSSCNITFSKTYTYGASIELKLTPPNPVIEANAGFKAEMCTEKGAGETFEQELSWAVDSQIVVPPGFQTRADLVIKEDDFQGDFEVISTFQGKILVTYEDKKNHEHIATITQNVSKVFTPQKGFVKDNQGRPTFVSRGVCKCKFGIEQNVKLKESPIPPPESES